MRAGDDVLALAEDALRAAKAKADAAEVFLFAEDGYASSAFGRHATGRAFSRLHVGVRLSDGTAVGFGEGSGDDAHAVREAVRRAVAALEAAPRLGKTHAFPAGTRGRARAFDAGLGATAEDAAGAVEEALDVFATDPAVSYSAATASATLMRFVTVSTSGAATADARAQFSINTEVRVREGGLQRGVRHSLYGAERLDASAFVAGLVADARATLRPVTFATGRVDVLFDATTTTTLYPTFVDGLRPAFVASGESRFSPGKSAVSPAFTFEDASDDPATGRARVYDDEGLPCRPITLVDRGVAATLLRTSAEAEAAGVPAPGRGFRQGLTMKDAPFAAPVNLRLAPGRDAIEDIVRDRERVVVVRRDVAGWYHSTGVTGAFSVVAPAAFLYERGECKGALPHATIGGNVFDALEKPGVVVGRERHVTRLGTGAPLLLPDLAVAV